MEKTSKDRIVELIYKAVDKINEEFPDQQLEKSLDTKLVGESAQLDSLGLISLTLDTEQLISDELNVTITFADERATSQEPSPFRTINTFADYAFLLIEEASSG